MTLTTFFNTIYKPLKLRRGGSGNTARLYGCTIRAFAKWLRRDPVLADLDELALAQYLEARAGQVAAYSVEKERSQLMSLARLANERRMIDRMPCCPPGVLPERAPEAWSIEEIRRLHQVAVEKRGYVGPIPAGVWWPALLDVLYETGERIGAIMDAKRSDFSPPFLTVRAEARKGRRRDRVYRLSPLTADRLRMCEVAGQEALLFWPCVPNHLYHHLRKMVEKAGLKSDRSKRFHQIRRTAASHLAAAGGDPVKFLDHANPSTTQRWYVDPRVADKGPAPCDILPRLDAG